MLTQHCRFRVPALVVGVVLLAFSGWAAADPPSRIARLGYTTGDVSFSPAGENDWDDASLNRPLTAGDRLWTEPGARAEVEMPGAKVRMNANTAISLLNLDDEITQLQLTQGVLHVRVRHLDPNQGFEVDTPNLAFTLRKPGAYRIEVDPEGDSTTIMVRKGQGEVSGEGASYVIDSKQAYRFTSNDLSDHQYVASGREDEFDVWAAERDRGYDVSISARYVSRDVVGYRDLDENGRWDDDRTYGKVWFPSHVAADWAPYRDGHWAWIAPWGWTWVDDQPWGFAVSHYGRWAHVGGRWGWVPGPRQSRAYYAPALVVFLGGSDFQLGISSGNVRSTAWFPLGPREVYRPAYPMSRRYFENINHSNTVINKTVIKNYYDHSNVTNIVHVNRRVKGAIVAVPTTEFVGGARASKAALRISAEEMDKAPEGFVARVAPAERSGRGQARKGSKPPARAFERTVIARTAPPAPRAGLAAHRAQLEANPGIPVEEPARKAVKRDDAATPSVKVIPREKVAQPKRLAAPKKQSKPAKQADKQTRAERRAEAKKQKQEARTAPIPAGAKPEGRPHQGAPSEPGPASGRADGRAQQGAANAAQNPPASQAQPTGRPSAPPTGESTDTSVDAQQPGRGQDRRNQEVIPHENVPQTKRPAAPSNQSKPADEQSRAEKREEAKEQRQEARKQEAQKQAPIPEGRPHQGAPTGPALASDRADGHAQPGPANATQNPPASPAHPAGKPSAPPAEESTDTSVDSAQPGRGPDRRNQGN